VARFSSVAAFAAAVVLAAAPALAQIELDTNDLLIFSGTDPAGTRSAVVRLFIGPAAIESGSTTYATAEQGFTATISLDDVSPYGVGLFRVEAETDSCSAAAWVRVSGRFPLATLTGLTAVGLAVGGATGQLGAISSRRRWARTAAALGGLATGTGIALVGQQFGRLQISFISVGLLVIATGFVGWVLAAFINPANRERRRAERASRPAPAPKPDKPRRTRRAGDSEISPADRVRENNTTTDATLANSAPETEPGTPAAQPDPKRAPTPEAKPHTAPEPQRAQPTSGPEQTPPPATAPYWCYVLAATDVFDLTDHTQTVASLSPGTWYLAKRTIGGWAHVVASDGLEGWVAESSIHRQG
jgi:hypothetical protein